MAEKHPQLEENANPAEAQLSESLEDRIRFETPISNLSTRFVNVPPDQVALEINRTQHT